MGENEHGDIQIQLVQQQQIPYSRLKGKWGEGLGMGDKTSPARTKDFWDKREIYHFRELKKIATGGELCSVYWKLIGERQESFCLKMTFMWEGYMCKEWRWPVKYNIFHLCTICFQSQKSHSIVHLELLMHGEQLSIQKYSSETTDRADSSL